MKLDFVFQSDFVKDFFYLPFELGKRAANTLQIDRNKIFKSFYDNKEIFTKEMFSEADLLRKGTNVPKKK